MEGGGRKPAPGNVSVLVAKRRRSCREMELLPTRWEGKGNRRGDKVRRGLKERSEKTMKGARRHEEMRQCLRPLKLCCRD